MIKKLFEDASNRAYNVYVFVNELIENKKVVLNLCSGFNGSEIDASKHERVIHVDIFENWIVKCKERYAGFNNI